MAELGKVEPGNRNRPAAHAPARFVGWVRRAAGRTSVRLFVGLLAAFSLCGVLVYGIVSWAFPYGFDSVVAAREAGAADVMQGDGFSTWTFAEAGGDPPGTGAAEESSSRNSVVFFSSIICRFLLSHFLLGHSTIIWEAGNCCKQYLYIFALYFLIKR